MHHLTSTQILSRFGNLFIATALTWSATSCTGEDSLGAAGDAGVDAGHITPGQADAAASADTKTPIDTRVAIDATLGKDTANKPDTLVSIDAPVTVDAPVSVDSAAILDTLVRLDASGLVDAPMSPDSAGIRDALDPNADAPVTCESDGVVYQVGQRSNSGGSGCSVSCACLATGQWGMCTGACPPDVRPADLATRVDGNPAASLCTTTGGTVSSALCCGSANDFPNSCLTGACGCSPDNSHTVSTCTCSVGCYLPGYGCAGPTNTCTEGADQTCNDNLAISSIHGRCITGGRCLCDRGWPLLASGKCQ